MHCNLRQLDVAHSVPHLGAHSPIIGGLHICFRFQIYSSLRNEGDPKASAVENRGHVLHFLTPVKITGRVSEMSVGVNFNSST